MRARQIVHALLVHLHALNWKHPRSVQLLVKEPPALHFTLYELNLAYHEELRAFLTSGGATPELAQMVEHAILLGEAEKDEAPPRRILLKSPSPEA